LRAYTRGGAYASFDEKDKGVLATGTLADFAIIDRDLTRIAPEAIRDAHIVLTAVGGKVVYERKAPE
jgi:predicted amidohydrolase YtcJ